MNGAVLADSVEAARIFLDSGSWLNHRDSKGQAQGKIVWLFAKDQPFDLITWRVLGVIPYVSEDGDRFGGRSFDTYAVAILLVVEASSAEAASTSAQQRAWLGDGLTDVTVSCPVPVGSVERLRYEA